MIANLKLLREKNKLSQQDLADALGISQQSVYKYEKQGTQPDHDTLIKIADYFEVSVDFLIGHTAVRDPSAAEMEFLEKYRLLSPEEQASIRMVVDNYIKSEK